MIEKPIERSAGPVRLATFNVENLSPVDPPEKFADLAEIVVDHLQSPDVLALEEVQDNTGPVNDGVVAWPADQFLFGPMWAGVSPMGAGWPESRRRAGSNCCATSTPSRVNTR